MTRRCYVTREALSICALLTAAGGGCAPAHPGTFDRNGFGVAKYGYQVRFRDARRLFFINADWPVDNFMWGASEGWVAKKGNKYLGHRVREKETEAGVEKEEVYFFDLKLTHRQTNGVIWIQTFELPRKHDKKKLDVLLANYSESLSGAGLYLEGSVYGIAQVKVKKHAAEVKERGWMRMGWYRALRAMIEIVDLDRKKIASKHPNLRVEVVLLRFWREYEGYRQVGARWVFGKYYAPVIMVVGYQNSGAYFAKYRPDFHQFLKQIRFRRYSFSKVPVLPRARPKRPAPRQPPPKKRPAAKDRPVTGLAR